MFYGDKQEASKELDELGNYFNLFKEIEDVGIFQGVRFAGEPDILHEEMKPMTISNNDLNKLEKLIKDGWTVEKIEAEYKDIPVDWVWNMLTD